MEISNSEASWLSLEREYVDGYVIEWIGHETTRSVSFAGLRSVVKIVQCKE